PSSNKCGMLDLRRSRGITFCRPRCPLHKVPASGLRSDHGRLGPTVRELSMSKQIKQLQMDALKQTFSGVKNMVVISSSKISAIAENQLRLNLRKKNIRLQQVKNSLAEKVFADLGINLSGVWGGSTVFAWGPESVKELSKELEKSFNDAEKKD